jgi:hypothetical protein
MLATLTKDEIRYVERVSGKKSAAALQAWLKFARWPEEQYQLTDAQCIARLRSNAALDATGAL